MEKKQNTCTDLVEEQDEIQRKGDEQSQEAQIVEVAGEIVLKMRRFELEEHLGGREEV